jgi:hypothetical protein
MGRPKQHSLRCFHNTNTHTHTHTHTHTGGGGMILAADQEGGVPDDDDETPLRVEVARLFDTM